MNRRLLTLVAAICILAARSIPLQGAAIPQITAPVLGYVFDDEAAGIRPISGVPGAASLDTPLDLGIALQGAFINSSGRVAVAIAKDGSTAVIRWGGQTPVVTPIETALGRVTMAALSGSFAALSDGVTVEVWSTLTDLPSRTASYSNLGGAVMAVAINSDGAAVMANDAGQIQTLQNGTAAVIAAGGLWTSVAFTGKDVLATDGQALQLIRISDALNNPGSSVVATFDSSPRALAASRDGTSAVVAFTDDLALVDGTGTVTSLACGCQAKGLQVIEGNLVVYLNGTGLLLDADTPGARFVTLPNSAPSVGDIAQ
ncbi:MAG: hypothetical protein ABI824_03750 [Acidobacteriota bacterium]